jgi:hypothetical protein
MQTPVCSRACVTTLQMRDRRIVTSSRKADQSKSNLDWSLAPQRGRADLRVSRRGHPDRQAPAAVTLPYKTKGVPGTRMGTRAESEWNARLRTRSDDARLAIGDSICSAG